MWIMTASGETLIDTDKCTRIFAADKGDAVLVSAAVDRTDKLVTLCKCVGMMAAKETLLEIADAIEREQAVYYAPDNFIDREMPKIQDARVKRRGGS